MKQIGRALCFFAFLALSAADEELSLYLEQGFIREGDPEVSLTRLSPFLSTTYEVGPT